MLAIGPRRMYRSQGARTPTTPAQARPAAPFLTTASFPTALVMLLFATPCWAQPTLTVYQTRTAWDAAAPQQAIEDLEREPMHLHPTPHTTAAGWHLTSHGEPVTLQPLQPGLIDETRSFHFRDFGNKVEFRFPEGLGHHAFGFDYYTSVHQTFELHVNGTLVANLQRGAIGFIGVVADEELHSFVVTSPAQTQGGCSVDNLTLGDLSDSCFPGNVDIAATGPIDVLLINGLPGAPVSRVVLVEEGDDIWATLLRPPAGGPGRFTIHANIGEPASTAAVDLPFGVGRVCFPFLISSGAAPIAVWNNLHRKRHLGASRYFDGSPVPDPPRADTIFLSLYGGDPQHLPAGTRITLQGIIDDPRSQLPQAIAVTNAVVLYVE